MPVISKLLALLTSGMVSLGYLSGLLANWDGTKLGWQVENGLKIKVRVDPIARHNSRYLLSEELREYLNDLGIAFLA